MRFRKWLFKLFFGCDLVEYIEILADWHRGLELSDKILKQCEKTNNEGRETLALAKAVNERCKMLLERCERMEANGVEKN